MDSHNSIFYCNLIQLKTLFLFLSFPPPGLTSCYLVGAIKPLRNLLDNLLCLGKVLRVAFEGVNHDFLNFFGGNQTIDCGNLFDGFVGKCTQCTSRLEIGYERFTKSHSVGVHQKRG
jgi:hypothetical protein